MQKGQLSLRSMIIFVTPKINCAKSRGTAITVLAMLKEKHSEEQHLQRIDESSSDCRMAARSLLYARIPDESANVDP